MCKNMRQVKLNPLKEGYLGVTRHRDPHVFRARGDSAEIRPIPTAMGVPGPALTEPE